MISISSSVSAKILALINEIRDAAPYELSPSLSTLELQAISLEIDEGLLAEIIALLSIYYSSISKQPETVSSKEEKPKIEDSCNNLIFVLNDIRMQESVININRIRR